MIDRRAIHYLGSGMHPSGGLCQLVLAEQGIGWRADRGALASAPSPGVFQLISWESVKWVEVDLGPNGYCLRVMVFDGHREIPAIELVPNGLFWSVRALRRLGVPVRTMPAADIGSPFGFLMRVGPFLWFGALLAAGGCILLGIARLESTGQLTVRQGVALRLGALGVAILAHLTALAVWCRAMLLRPNRGALARHQKPEA
jgi:hypothetical protein